MKTPDELRAQLDATRKADEAERMGRLLAHDCGVPECGNRRCDRCDERLMCTGPEPAVTCSAHVECVDCEADNTCRDCATIRRATAVAAAAWEAADEPGPYVDPLRDVWIDVAAEERADRRAHELAHLEDREEAS